MKDILLITNFWHFECEKSSSRYLHLANILSRHGYGLEVVTSTFYHRVKKAREFSKDFLTSFPYKVTLINEPPYSHNISLRRLHSHKIFARNVISYLSQRKRPDLILVVIPSTYLAENVVKFANNHRIPVVLDIQDLWPEAFQMAFRIPLISDICFAPLKKLADEAYKNADYITAVSQTYVERGMSVNKKSKQGTAIYLGADFDHVQSIVRKSHVNKDPNEFWVSYIGSLGHSYNIKMVIDALAILKNKGIVNIKFQIFGNGVLEDEFRYYATQRGVDAEFWGHRQYDEMIPYLAASEIAVNPIVGKSVASIINKVCDYATAGVPVVNDQNSDEYRNLLEKYHAGLNCENNNARQFADAIMKLYQNESLRRQMKEGALRLAREKFDRDKTYLLFVDVIENILSSYSK